MGDYHSNIHNGDLVKVGVVRDHYKDNDSWEHLQGKEGIVTYVQGVELEDDEHVVSFLDENKQEVLAVFRDDELVPVLKSAPSTVRWMTNVMSFFKRR